MVFNLLKIAFRNIKSQIVNSIIQITGFTFAIVAVLFISTYVLHETSYDNFHLDSNNIFRIFTETQYSEYELEKSSVVIENLGEEIVNKVAGIDSYTRVFKPWYDFYLKKETQVFKEKKVAFVEPSFFDMFSFPLVRGEKEDFANPNTIILNESLALKYFGHIDIINNHLNIRGAEYRIVGVMKDMPTNTHFSFHMFISLATIDKGDYLFNQGASIYTYLKIDNKSSFDLINSQIQELGKEVYAAYDERKGRNPRKVNLGLQALESIHLRTDFYDEMGGTNDYKTVRNNVFLVIFLILISAINFINSYIVISEKRANFLGIQKVYGAKRWLIMLQVYIEVLVFILISLLVAAIIFFGLKSYTTTTFSSTISLFDILDLKSIIIISIVLICIIFFTGTYPALFLSKLSPKLLFEGHSSNGVNRKTVLYNTLVVFQLGVAIFLTVNLLGMKNQINYLKSKDLGFKKESLVVFWEIPYKMTKHLSVIKEKLLQNVLIDDVTITGQIPGEEMPESKFSFNTNEPNWIDCQMIRCDPDYISTFEIDILEGRNFSEKKSNDQNAVIINEKVAKTIGRKKILGEELLVNGRNLTIIGIVKNFHTNSLHKGISPVVMFLGESGVNHIVVSYEKANFTEALMFTKKVLKEVIPDYIVEFNTMEDFSNSHYKNEEKNQNILNYFTYVAIVIAMMGIWAFSTLYLKNKTKELAIRIVCGAQTDLLFFLLLKNISKWLLLSFLISLPPALYYLSYWLNNFEFKAAEEELAIIKTLIIITGVTLLSVSYYLVRITRIQTTEALKIE